MKVLSLFDGMSCGRIALERVGIQVNKYYACEIDKWAIQISTKNYPDIVQLGSVTDVDGTELPDIDLLIGGSPCQAFSNAGKGEGFDDPRGKLFWEYVRLLRETKPRYFLLENVVMKQEHQDVITKALGVEPVMINSADFSAQNRKRLYWTNIPIKGWKRLYGGPADTMLADILETVPSDPTFMSDKFIARNGDKGCMITTDRPKARTLSAMEYVKNGRQGNYLACDNSGRGLCRQVGMASSATKYRKLTPLECERLQTVPDGYTEGVSNTQRYKMLGNGWTVDVIAHILKSLDVKEEL